jgi:hypothetical protein
MQNDLVFKIGTAKKALGWFVCLGAAGLLVATIYAIFIHRETLTSADLWSGIVIGAFLACLSAYGIAMQHVRWEIEGDTIIFHRIFGKKTIPISDLEGFGRMTIIFYFFPFLYVDLYDRKPNILARLPINPNDWPKAEAWLAANLRYVVNHGSHIFPKPRFIDDNKI